jgi:EAL and modified HD-GYP domain-containing signal transduction protein
MKQRLNLLLELALINFSEESLLNGLPLLLPSDQIMIEILEDTNPSDEVYQACRELYHKGYSLALDDFIYKPEWGRFLNLVKLIKFDLMQTPLEKIAPLVEKLKTRKKLKLLAEKVETKEEFLAAKKLGFHFFQGYYFCKPEMKESRSVDENQVLLMLLLHEILKKNVNLNVVIEYFTQDMYLCYKLLRYINSGLLPLTESVNSIKQAVIYLGEDKVKKLIILLTTGALAKNKPKELMRIAIIRANFCELMAKYSCPELQESAFLTGLFSLLDAALDKPLVDILPSLPLSIDIVDALTKDKRSPLSNILTTIKYYEKGAWFNTKRYSELVNVGYEEVGEFYQSAVLIAEKFDRDY